MMSFVQLQVITTNSLMESTMTVEQLVHQLKKLGYHSAALTDHNVMYGTIEFYERAINEGLKPIVGLTLDIECYINPEQTAQIVLLAKNKDGYQNLIQLSTHYQLTEKAIPLSELILRSKGLLVIAPTNQGEVGQLLQEGRHEEANSVVRYYDENFEDYYTGITSQNLNQNILSFVRQLTTPIVALGNVKYLDPVDASPAKVMQVLNQQMPLGEEHQAAINHFLAKEEDDYSLKSAKEMEEKFVELGLETAVTQTKKIAEKISLSLELKKVIMPVYDVPQGETSASFLRKLCEVGLNERVTKNQNVYQERLSRELDVIIKMGFADYFLIVWDIMKYAHQKNIYTGSGRGSAAGSLVAYLLRITNTDPIQYDLLFERFLNEERFTMPDIDLDFPDNKREEILNYIHHKYGHEFVAQIGTIGTYGAKSAVRDVARVLGLSQAEISKWSKAIPSGSNVKLEDAYKSNEISALLKGNPINQRVFELAKRIQGSNRHISTHAAAVVIADHPITDLSPLQKGGNELQLTQYTMEAVEKVGLLKFDILGLRNLSTLADCIRFISYESKDKTFDIDSIPFDDEKTLDIFRQGKTDGVFQFESEGIRRVLKRLKPTSFEDIVAVNALYRPGPMEQIDTFIQRKNGHEVIRYPHEDLKEILEVTYGIMVYQEQVMQVASKLAGYSLNEADVLRRAISKKDHEEIENGRRKFVQGALKHNYTEETALEVYGYIEQFGDYGFNRSHAVAYSRVAYQLAYVKANYPASFYAAIMRASNKDKVKSYQAEAKLSDVKFLGPDINKSFTSFSIEDGSIRFGLDCIKGIPRNFVQEIIKERMNNGKYSDLIQFLNRIDNKWLKEDLILPFIYAGAFDDLSPTRNSYLQSLSSVLESTQMSYGNVELFEIFAPTIIKKEELSEEDLMRQEYEATGYYFSSEPGAKYQDLRNKDNIHFIADVKVNQSIKILVEVENIKTIQTKKGEPMSFVDAIDRSGKASLTLFPNTHRRFIQSMNKGDTLLVEGKVESTQSPIKIIANKINRADILLEQLENNQNNSIENNVLYIRFQSLEREEKKLIALQQLIKEHKGNVPVIIYDQETKEQKAFKKEFHVNVHQDLMELLKKMFGNNNIVLKSSEN